MLAGRQIDLTWTEDASGADPQAFYVDIGKKPGGTELGSTSVLLQNFTTGYLPAGTYYIRVRAWNSAGASAPGNEVRVYLQ